MPSDLLFELGCEEMPVGPLQETAAAWRETLPGLLRGLRLKHGEMWVSRTPRRLVLHVGGVADTQEPLCERRRGPAAKVAFDAEGRPSAAAEGFARSAGVDVEDLVVESDEQGEYVWAVSKQPGRPAKEVLPAALERQLVRNLVLGKSMRWGSGELRFVRPIRWIVALLGPEVLPVEIDGLKAGRLTFGHRFLAPGPFELKDASQYRSAIEELGGVVVDAGTRAEAIEAELVRVAREAGFRPVFAVGERPFLEVIDLVEAPHVVLGSFEAEHTRLPREVLATAMESHQRYFPVEDGQGRLAPGFLVVHNGDPARGDAIRRGHERVLKARLADAGFFFDEDRKRPLAERIDDLKGIVFQERLGTMYDKAVRIEALAGALAELLGEPNDICIAARRAALLAKADLLTDMVGEFPDLQGVMGREYALLDGESPTVAEAIFEHYLPRGSDDDLPKTRAGALVSIADKIDTIVGCFAAGLIPTGSQDPYALRRQALAILRIAIEQELKVEVPWLVERALSGHMSFIVRPTEGSDAKSAPHASELVRRQVESFLSDRLRTYLVPVYGYDRVDAVLSRGIGEPAGTLRRIKAVAAFMETPGADDLLIGYTRAKNLADPGVGAEPETGLMGDAERALFDAVIKTDREIGQALERGDFEAALGTLAALRGPVDTFFDEVLVMDEDEGLRANRLRLLNRVVAVFERLADLSRIVVAGPSL